MPKLLKAGRIIFSVGTIALAVLCFIMKDFIVGRPPAWSAGSQVNPTLAYATGAVLIICSIAILLNKAGKVAALTIALLILTLSVVRHIPQYMEDWANTYKSIAMFGGALIVAASFYPVAMSGSSNWRRILIISGSICVASFFLIGGYAHFKYADFVNFLIPDYIPFHSFWTYFCGVCLLAGGVGLLIPQTARLAALLGGIMIAGWFLLLHIPRFIANTKDASDRMGLCESFTFVGILFVLAALHSRNK